MSRPPLPPPLARRLLALLATDSLGDDMLAELEAEFRIRAAEDGLGAARRWYRRQVWLSVPALLGARRRARPETGRGARPVVEFFRDTRLALRTLRGAPMFSLVAIATLALGIGTSTAVFSVVNGVVLRPLPYRSPDRLVQVWGPQAISKATLVRIRNEVPALGRTAGFYRERAVLTGIDDALEVTGTAVSANYFDVLGVAPALGRFFRPDENEPARADAIVLSHGLWSRAFGRDPGVIGRQVTLAGRSRTVVGVTSPGHRAMLPGTEFWIPYTADPTDFSDYEGLARLELIARLDDGVPAARAAADLGVLARALQRERPESYSDEWVGRATVVPLATSLTAGVASPLWTMLGAVAFVLLIACANVANLLLARGTGRAAEIAVRMGLGASRNRVIRQLLAESTVLGALGGLAGLGLAVAAVVLAGAALPASVLRGEPIVVDRTVLAFGLAVSLASSLLFGVAPAVQATGRGVAAQLREGRGRAATANRRRHGVTMGLVSLQIAASVTLVTGAGLMVRSFAGIRAADLGFVPEQA
ncbi:MAG: ABC transporter permease, partial [Gemmatimonadales bacterium]